MPSKAMDSSSTPACTLTVPSHHTHAHHLHAWKGHQAEIPRCVASLGLSFPRVISMWIDPDELRRLILILGADDF